MSIKVGWESRDMRISRRIVGVRSTKQSVGIKDKKKAKGPYRLVRLLFARATSQSPCLHETLATAATTMRNSQSVFLVVK